MSPRHRQVLAAFRGQPAATGAHRRVRVVVDLTTGDDRGPLVEQADEGADESGLALPAFAEQHDVVPGQQRAFQLREHRVGEPDDAREALLTGAEPGEQILPDLDLDAAMVVAGGPQRVERADAGSVGPAWGGGHGGRGHLDTLCPPRPDRRLATGAM